MLISCAGVKTKKKKVVLTLLMLMCIFCGTESCCINGGCVVVGAAGRQGTEYARSNPGGAISPLSGVKNCLSAGVKFPCTKAQQNAATGCLLCCCQVIAGPNDSYATFAKRSNKFSTAEQVRQWNGGRNVVGGKAYQIC